MPHYSNRRRISYLRYDGNNRPYILRSGNVYRPDRRPVEPELACRTFLTEFRKGEGLDAHPVFGHPDLIIFESQGVREGWGLHGRSKDDNFIEIAVEDVYTPAI